MYIVRMKEVRKAISEGSGGFRTVLDGKEYRFGLSWQKTGFGQRCFMVCPACGKRFASLYIKDQRIRCRKCAGINPYYPIQFTTKGGYAELEYRMRNLAAKHDITFTLPFDYQAFLFDQRLQKESFQEVIRILQALENMRAQSIFFNKTYPARHIKAVLMGRHPTLSGRSLQELRDYYLSW